MIVINQTGNVAAGTSTNGAKHKVPGFVLILFKKSICVPIPAFPYNHCLL